MNRVFVSYSRRNKNFAERLARDLGDAGLEVWIDFRQIHAGEMWQEEIFRGIERSNIIIACLSPDAVVSEWVQREVNTAREHGKLIVPVMVADALKLLEETENMRWLLDVHFINFENNYEAAFPELLLALPGGRRVGAYDDVDPAKIRNPFKGLEAFQQTDAHVFFGRENLIEKSLERLKEDRPVRFLAVVGASGSGKSSMVRAGVLPALRRGQLPGSDQWRLMIFTPGTEPIESLSQRIAPLVEDKDSDEIENLLQQSPQMFDALMKDVLADAPDNARVLLIVDQFEEVFTRASDVQARLFLDVLHHAVTVPNGRALVLITMRADFFDRLSHYPRLAELFEQENMVIVTEMTAPQLLRSIQGPAEAVGLIYDQNLPQRILDDVRRQPGSLPLLQYALKELYQRREGARLTTNAYEEIGGVRRALAQHAEDSYSQLNAAQQGVMRRIMLRLVEIGDNGEATRRRVNRHDLDLRGVPSEAVQELVDELTSAESRLLIASRQITASEDAVRPETYIEVGHEALIREWDRLKGWIAENLETLRYGSELLQAAHVWETSNHDKAYLLTGNRLVRAEAWLINADATDLQREFIQASTVENDRQLSLRQQQIERELLLQRKATRRLQLFVGGLVLSLVGAIVLIGLAVRSQRQANEALEGEQIARETAVANEQLAIANEQLALVNEQQALSLALSASASRAMGDNELELAVLLAIVANQIDNPPPQSQRTLAEVAYSPSTRHLLRVNSADIHDAAFNPGANQALYAVESDLFLIDTTTGLQVLKFDAAHSLSHTETINALAFHPDGKHVITGGEDGKLIMWDVKSGQPTQQFGNAEGAINTVAFSPDGEFFASGGQDRIVTVWHIASGERQYALSGHEGAINAIDFSADNTRIVSGSDDDTVKVWSRSGAFIRTLSLHDADVTTVAFNPLDDDEVISGSDDNTIIQWEVSTGDVTNFFAVHDGNVNRVAYMPDGESFVSASDDRDLIWWDADNGQLLAVFSEHNLSVLDVAFSADSQFMLSTSADGTVRLWDMRDVEIIQQYTGHESGRLSVGVYSDDGRLVLSGSHDMTLRLWDRDTGLTIQQFIGHDDRVTGVAMNADGTTALSGSTDQSVILWNIATGEIIQRMIGHESPINAVAYLPDGQHAVSAAANGGLILWDLSTGTEITRYGPAVAKGDVGHGDEVYAVAVNPDGTRMLSASADKTLILWDIETGAVIRSYKGHNDEVESVAFNHDGTRAVSGADNGSVIIWDVTDDTDVFGGVIRLMTGHDRAVHGVTFSPDGSRVVSGSEDRTLRLWDVETGFELRRYSPTGKVYFSSVAFHNAGMSVLTGMSDSHLIEWRVLLAPSDLISWAFANRFVPEPTCEEREQYRIVPLCEDDRVAPTRTPFPIATTTPAPSKASLQVGYDATVNTDDGEPLNVRAEPSINADEITELQDGATVTLLDGPIISDGFTWWQIRTENGTEGWTVESVPDEHIQTLIP